MRTDAPPAPLAALLRRGRNAKSAKERHDLAYFAWEAAIRLAAVSSPRVRSLAAKPSVGAWVRAVEVGSVKLDDAAIIEAYRLLCEVGADRRVDPKSVSAAAVLEAVPAYRNAAVGHGAVRPAEFYGPAADKLIAGFEALWRTWVLWPEGAALVYVDGIELDSSGDRRARVLHLAEVGALLLDPRGLPVPDGVVPQRLYLHHDEHWQSLYPWLLYQSADLRERVLFFNGRGRSARYLDYVRGEELRGRALREAFPDIESAFDEALSRNAPCAEDSGSLEEPTAEGRMLGDYELLGKLGEGGMGIVYLARQRPLDRLVALKTLPPSLADDPTAVARFEREVEALARCEHPNVIKVYGAGVAEGRHFYAMELVVGADLAEVGRALTTIDDFAQALSSASERTRAALRERFDTLPDLGRTPPVVLERGRGRLPALTGLFGDAARGVAHLHEQGIVHRDLKPGNLMVTEGEQRVVVMDLGLAALGDASRSITQDRTSLLGTLRYMPPEQLQRNLLQVDQRADIYSLGATFYELLTGRPMFDGDTEVRLVEQVLREDPLPVRTANPKVADDLARIVEKATHKDPRQRYETANALADDLQAYLDGRPIRARPPSIGYLLRKAAGRHRVALLGMAAGLVGLSGMSTLGAVYQEHSRRARCEDRELQLGDAWNDERREAVKAGLLATEEHYAPHTWPRVEAGLDAYADDWMATQVQTCAPDAALSDDLRTKKVLCMLARKRALAALVDVLQDAGPNEVEVEKVEDAVRSLPDIDRCTDLDYLAATLAPPDAPAVEARVQALRDDLGRAEALGEAGSPAQGLEVASQVVQETRTLEYEPLLAEALRVQGELQEAAGDYEAAEATLREAYTTAVATGHDEVAAYAAAQLVWVVGYRQARHEAGLEWAYHTETLERRAREEAPSASLLNNIGAIRGSLAEYDAALVLYQRALAIREATLDADHASLAPMLNNIGRVHTDRGEYEEALAILQRALTIEEAALGASHPRVAGSLNLLGRVYFFLGEIDQALQHYQRALTIQEAALGPNHPYVATSLTGIAAAHTYLGKSVQSRAHDAIRHYERALTIKERALGSHHPDVGMLLGNIGIVHDGMGKHDEALGYFQRARTVFESAFGPGHPLVAESLHNIGDTYISLGEYEIALEHLSRALAAREAALGEGHPDVAYTLYGIGRVHHSLGEYDKALEYLRRALTIREAATGANNSLVAPLLTRIAEVYGSLGEYDEALTHHRRALAIVEAELGSGHPDVAYSLAGMGAVNLAEGQPEKAIASFERALELREGRVAPKLMAETRFGLAKALWLANHDRARAVELARKTRDEYEAVEAAEEELAEVEAWLTHRSRRAGRMR